MILSIHIINELSTPTQNGIVVFVSGFLFILGVFHFFLYFQHKDKSYLYYSLYALLVFIYTFHRDPDFLLTKLISPALPTLHFLYDAIKWLYSIIYIYFAISFIQFYKYNPKWDRVLRDFAKISLWILLVLTIYSMYIHDNKLLEIVYNYAFLPLIFIIGLYSLYLFYKTESPVKNYLLIGAGVYLVLTTFSHILTYTGHPFRVLFYFAVTFEIILFALGLGKKQKLILEEKNRWQNEIIREHEENLRLKEEITHQMDEKVKQKTSEIIQLMQENEAQKREKIALQYSKEMIKLRMSALQAQMNPHFLFNSLNSIKHFIINNEQKKSISYLTKFAKLIRNVLDYSGVSEISLKEELEIMKLYLEIENIRFDNQLQCDFIIHPAIDLNKIKVPPLILQAIIENAVWHGLAPKKEDKKIIIKIEKEKINNQNFIHIEILDNGIGRKKAGHIYNSKSNMLKKKPSGISITEERLKVFAEKYAKDYRFEIEDLIDEKGDPKGTKVILEIEDK